MSGMSAEEVLAGLDPEQRAAAQATRGPVVILAGAGTGKTRAITHRIAYAVATGAVPPGQVLAVTFTARAAGEMRGRLRALGVEGVTASTFHAAALRQLRYFWPQVVGGAFPDLIDRKLPVVAEAAARCGERAGGPELRDLAAEIEWAKASVVAPEGYQSAAGRAGRQPPRTPGELARIYAAYEEVKRARGLLDFEDLLLLTAAALEEHPLVVAEVRSRYRHLVVDEYQDVNPLQQRLLDAWLGDRDDICVVGDPNQTIYSFTGATPAYLLEFPRRHPGATVVRLVRTYRCTPQVAGLANALLAGRSREKAPIQLVSQQPAGPAPSFAELPDEEAEAAEIAGRCAKLVADGVAPAEIAVLYRVNAQSEAYEAALGAAGLPYLVRGGERFFERAEVRTAVRLLRGAARSTDAEAADGLLPEVGRLLAVAGWSPAPPAGTGAVRDRWESLAALARLAEELAAASPGAGLTEFVAELESRAASSHVPAVAGVTLASLHAAKGLEWDAVFLVGLADGMVPIVHADSPEQVEEERRLLYVGMTRARRHLSLSWARARSPGGRAHRRPSRFLDGLAPALAGPRPAGSRREAAAERRGTARCRVCGRALVAGVARKLGRCESCPASVDEALFDRLRIWRLERAQEAAQPAYCVFTDATLTAIAEARPATRAQLAAISGVGARKLERYGTDVLTMVGAGGPDQSNADESQDAP
jgi:DNA helicase-2/ATP-dependent DNA helicase PcrA